MPEECSPLLNKNRKAVIFNIIALAAFAGVLILLLRKAFYGLGTPDESFYLTIPYRVLMGDKLLVNEWHASQLSSFLQILPMWAYVKITGSAEGVILFFRLLFAVCQTLLGAFTFVALRRFGALRALAASLIFTFYITENVMSLDYYTMSLMGAQVAALLMFVCVKKNGITYFFAGVVTACVVAAQPFNALGYFAYCVAVLIFLIKKRRGRQSDFLEKYCTPRIWLCITAGIMLVFVLFMVFILSQETLGEFIKNLPMLFSGHDHVLPFAQGQKSDMFSYYVLFESLFSYNKVMFITSAAVFFAIAADRKRISHRPVWAVIAAFVFCIYIAAIAVSYKENVLSFLYRPWPLFVFGAECFMLTEKKDRELMCVYFTGAAYFILLGVISQALDAVGAIGFVISGCACVLMAGKLLDELCAEYTSAAALIKLLATERRARKPSFSKKKSNKKAELTKRAPAVFAVLLCTGLLADILLSALPCIGNDSVSGSVFGRNFEVNDTLVESGALKGIYVSRKTAAEYNDIMYDLEEVGSKKTSGVLVAGLLPWCYFNFDSRLPTFTTWYIKEELYVYADYYSAEDTLPPSYIYIPYVRLYWPYPGDEGAQTALEYFTDMFDTELTEGRAGYKIKVIQ